MAKKDNFWNTNDDVWAYPGNDEEEVSAQEGTVIREYRFDSREQMLVSFERMNFALSDPEENTEESDVGCHDAEKELELQR